MFLYYFFFFQAEDGIRDDLVTGVQTCALPITGQQYNVLRILRGVHPDPLPVLEIAERMIEETPGITGLLDRLESKGLVRRQRCTADRRQVHCYVTAGGLALLTALDPLFDAVDADAIAPLSAEDA